MFITYLTKRMSSRVLHHWTPVCWTGPTCIPRMLPAISNRGHMIFWETPSSLYTLTLPNANRMDVDRYLCPEMLKPRVSRANWPTSLSWTEGTSTALIPSWSRTQKECRSNSRLYRKIILSTSRIVYCMEKSTEMALFSAWPRSIHIPWQVII